MKTLYCHDFVDAGIWEHTNCCDSCHDDADRGYSELCDYSPEGRSNVYAEVCCRFEPPFKRDKSRQIFAKVLWHKRKAR